MSKGYNITVRQEDGTWVARVYTVDSITELIGGESAVSAERAVSLALQRVEIAERMQRVAAIGEALNEAGEDDE